MTFSPLQARAFALVAARDAFNDGRDDAKILQAEFPHVTRNACYNSLWRAQKPDWHEQHNAKQRAKRKERK